MSVHTNPQPGPHLDDPHASLAQEAEVNARQPHPALEDEGTFPEGGTEEQIWEFLLRYAVRAPSGHNTQPWRFHIGDGRLQLCADRRRGLPVVDPEDRELVMSCGAALAHLTVALRHFGYAGDVSPFPDPADRDLLATVGLGQVHRGRAIISCSRPSTVGTRTAPSSRPGPSPTRF